ncbi:MAG: class II aldolase/adducin family protein [Bryobacterales bacterium]|nr:class II aldolase/adducin family protein [Bryobacterales bacterium]
MSIREGERVWITPTGCSLRKVTPEMMALIDMDGKALNGCKGVEGVSVSPGGVPGGGEQAGALVHLHCTYTVALSCLADLDEAEPLPVFTPYYLMRVAPLAVLPYFRPGVRGAGRGGGRGGGEARCDVDAEPRGDHAGADDG